MRKVSSKKLTVRDVKIRFEEQQDDLQMESPLCSKN